MDDALAWLFDVVCDWFAEAPTDALGDPMLAAIGIAAEVAGADGNQEPGFLARVLDRAAKVATDEIVDVALAAVKRNLPGSSLPVRQAATAFLTKIPDNVRATFRRPADPQGLTVPPGLSLRTPEVLAVALGGRPPRFRPGQHPLPGVDLELVSLLGVGGFGEVWKAKNPLLPSVPPVALKFCTDPEAARLLRHEAAVLDRVMRAGAHPGIVALRHTYLSADPPALEYEFVGGGNLGDMIANGIQKPLVLLRRRPWRGSHSLPVRLRSLTLSHPRSFTAT